tara:strand:+ start:179 stop:451 length:273 start_codon:yes stop_codon:yes gene_type:complete
VEDKGVRNMVNKQTKTKDRFRDLAFEVLEEEDGPLPCNILRERVRGRKGATRFVNNVTARQVAQIMKADKRFQRVESNTYMRVQLWSVKK